MIYLWQGDIWPLTDFDSIQPFCIIGKSMKNAHNHKIYSIHSVISVSSVAKIIRARCG